MTAAELVKALGGRNGMAKCPVHKGGKERTPSLSISDGPDGKVLVKCHAGCSQADVWAGFKDLGLVGNAAPSSRRAGAAPKRPEKTEAEHIAIGLAKWEASEAISRSPAHDHLHGRGIMIPSPPCLRYHRRNHSMVALVQARDGTFSGVQETYLVTDARGVWKKNRLSFGVMIGAAIRLSPPAQVLHLCESVEDGLALQQMIGRACWAVPGAGFMAAFKPPPGVHELVLAPDHDDAGRKAITAATKALATPERKVRQLLPPEGRDWCEVLETVDERAGIKEFDGEQDREDAEQRSWVEAFIDGN